MSTPTRCRPAVLLLLTTLAAACGARSSLLADAPAQVESSGAGGNTASSTSSTQSSTTTTTTTTTTTGSGGSGGAELLCTGLALTGPPLGIDGVPGFDELRPQLIPEGDGSAKAILAWSWEGVETWEGGSLAVDKVGVTDFDAWGAWPADVLAYGWMVTLDGGSTLAAGPGVEDTVAIAVTHDLPGWEPGIHIHTAVKPQKPSGFPAALVEAAIGRPLFVAGGPTQALGYERTFTPTHYNLRFARIVWGVPAELTPDVGCATMPLAADAIPFGPGHLLAYSSGRPFGSCQDDDGIPGPPTDLQLAIAGEIGFPKLLVSFEGEAPIAWIDLVRRPKGQGVFLIHGRQSPGAGPTHLVTMLDEEGQVTGSFPLDATVSPWRPGLANLADLLATARLDAVDPSAPSVVVELWNSEGKRVAEYWIPSDQEAWATPELSLMASPAGDALLVAWSAIDMNTGARVLRVARLGCL